MTAPDPSRVIVSLALDQVNLDLKSVDLCFLAGLWVRADVHRSAHCARRACRTSFPATDASTPSQSTASSLNAERAKEQGAVPRTAADDRMQQRRSPGPRSTANAGPRKAHEAELLMRTTS